MARIVLPDTSLLRNFDTVGRLDLVAKFCQCQAPAWSHEVAEECRRQHLHLAFLRSVFGTPVVPSRAQMSDALVLRDNFFPAKNGDPNRGREDLGECVTFAIWADRAAPGEIFFVLSEDVDVVRFCHATRIAYTSEARFMAGRRAVAVTSTDLLGALARQGLITATAAKDVQRSILEQDRPLIGRAQDIV